MKKRKTIYLITLYVCCLMQSYAEDHHHPNLPAKNLRTYCDKKSLSCQTINISPNPVANIWPNHQ